MDIPQDVLQNIFIFLDGASIMKCRRVCSSWLREVEHCELLPNFWKHRCIEEVRWDFLPNYIAKINPIYFEDKNIAFSWKDVYICWYRWKLLGKWSSKLKELDIKRPGQIIRAEFYGNWIVYGTNEYNALIACHMASPACSAKILYEGARLKDFQFVSSENPSRTPFGAVFINTERDSCVLDLHQRRVIGAKCFSSFSDYKWCCEMILSKRNQLKAINPDIETIENHLILPENFYYFNHDVFRDREIGTKAKWIILHHKVALGIGDTPDYQHVVAFVVGEKFKLYYPSVNLGKISTAKLHGNNFFVGTSNVMLHHYTIKNIEDFLDFDFFQFDWSIKVYDSPMEDIMSIDVCELYKRPYVAVAIGSCRIVIVDFMDDDQAAEQYFPNVLTALD